MTKPINNIYHIYNRGVDKRNVFLEKRDYLRFIHDLFEFNDEAPATPSNITYQTRKPAQIQAHTIDKCLEVQPLNKKEQLTHVLAFCLMPNHFHLLLQQISENGIEEFMRKLGTGYTGYFNLKHKRSGHLFQGRYKSEEITDDAYLLHIPTYIHLNPLDISNPGWREKQIENPEEALKFLKNYRWSSFLDYIGQKNFPSVTQREFLQQIIGDSKEYKKEIKQWLWERKTITPWASCSKFE
ncbi:MAG: transposase [Nanoarchaeota archaeon]|nr:transposase [Nanoarchaeota archaeon]